MALDEIVRNPVYAQVTEHLREAILRGDFPPGASLPTERELAERFGVSRTSVREALRVLQAHDLVAGGGATSPMTVVAPNGRALRTALQHLLALEQVTVDDLVGLRCAIESAALRAAAARTGRGGPASELDDARRALAVMRRDGVDLEVFDRADVDFHLALVSASGNRSMHVVMLALRDTVARHLLEALHARNDQRASLRSLSREHAGILKAVEAGDGEAAARLVQDHIVGFYRSAPPKRDRR